MNYKISSFYDVPPQKINSRPQEDYLSFNKDAKAFVVADGVGLWDGIEYIKKYPNTSGSGKISKIFCQSFIKYLTKNPKANIQKAFEQSNIASATANKNRSKYNILKNKNGLFAATAAMAHIKNNVLEWAQICDSGIMVINKDGKIRLKQDSYEQLFNWPNDIKKYDTDLRILIFRSLIRNAVDKNNKAIGYGIITGEPEVNYYLKSGKLKLSPGDCVFLYTDGFTPYLEIQNFRKMIINSLSEKDLQKNINNFIQKQIAPIKNKLSNYKISPYKNTKTVEKELCSMLQNHKSAIKWAKEKSLVIIKVSDK